MSSCTGMDGLAVRVEVLDKTNLPRAIAAARQKARDWGVSYVTFKIENTTFFISPTAKVEEPKEWQIRQVIHL